LDPSSIGVDAIQDPLELRRRGERAHEHALFEQSRAASGGALILPGDRRMDRPPAGRLPDDRRRPLGGEAEAADGTGGHAGHGRAQHARDRRQERVEVVLEEPRPGRVRQGLAVRLADDGARGVDQQRPDARGADVERQHALTSRPLTHGSRFYCMAVPAVKPARGWELHMLVKMRRDASRDEIDAVEHRIVDLGFKVGKMIGEEITLIGVYGDSSRLPTSELEEMAGVDQLIPISRAYKRAAQKGAADKPIYQTVKIGSVVCGGDELVVISGPCSVESEPQIME